MMFDTKFSLIVVPAFSSYGVERGTFNKTESNCFREVLAFLFWAYDGIHGGGKPGSCQDFVFVHVSCLSLAIYLLRDVAFPIAIGCGLYPNSKWLKLEANQNTSMGHPFDRIEHK